MSVLSTVGFLLRVDGVVFGHALLGGLGGSGVVVGLSVTGI